MLSQMLSHIKNKSLINHWFTSDCLGKLRFRADSNRCRWFCRPLPSRSATEPFLNGAKVVKVFYLIKILIDIFPFEINQLIIKYINKLILTFKINLTSIMLYFSDIWRVK